MAVKKVYKNPQNGQPLISVISSGCRTPLLDIKYCNILKPFYYPNSPGIARYSITCIIDPEIHKDFLKGIQTIEKNEGVESIVKQDSVKKDNAQNLTGKRNIKFQSKEIIPIYACFEDEEPEQIELEDEIAKGEKVEVVYDILRYTTKNTIATEHGLSFKPSAIYYYPTKKM